jgi:ParB family chromosome partitioning protein
VNIAKLKANPRQPRQAFAGEALKELSASIKEKGILQPIVARPLLDGQFEIIAGERRWRAAQAAGLHEVPVILKSTPDQEALELALIENIQRENLNPMEEAEAFNHLLQTYALTQQQLADKIGKDRATVANTLRLLSLGKPTRDLVASGQLSMGHAKVLLAVTDQAQQKQLADRVTSKKWSVRELEREVAQILKPKNTAVTGSALDGDVSQKFMAGLSEELQKIIGTKVSMDYDKVRGRISIQFYSDDELNGIVERLKDSWRK